MTDVFRERIAGAIRSICGPDCDAHAAAEEVLAAMREPTEAMVRAGAGRTVAQTYGQSPERDLQNMRDCWANMIHAATTGRQG